MPDNPYDQFTDGAAAPTADPSAAPPPTTLQQAAPQTFTTKDRKGRTVQFTVPAGASDDDVRQAGAKAVGSSAYLRSQVQRASTTPSTSAAPGNPYDQFAPDQPSTGADTPDPGVAGPNSFADPKAFSAEVGRRFDEGASAGDLESFARDNGFKLSDLANAIALKSDPNGGGFKPSTFWGALENITGPQINHLAGAVSGALEAPFSNDTMRQNVTRDQIGVDAESGAFADNHPIVGAGLGIYGSMKMLPAKGYQALLGAAQGAMQSQSYNPLEVGVDAGKGAVGAVAGSRLLGGVGAAVAPRINPMIQRLVDAGVRPTLGQIARVGEGIGSRVVSSIEDRATAMPIVGEMINRARAGVDTQFRQGALRQVLDPIGVQLPANVDTGHAMVDFAQRAVSNAYDSALRRMQMIPDQLLAHNVQGLVYSAQNGGLSQPLLDRFRQDISNVVARRVQAGGGQLDGDALQTTLSSLRQKAGRFGQSQDAEQREYGDALSELADYIEGAAERSSPADAVAARNAANEAYAHLVRVEGAAKNATAGDFSPGQLETAVRQGGSRVRGRDVSAGRAVGQDYATAGRRVLPSRTGSSGTTERRNTFNPIAWGTGAALIPGQLAAQHVVAPFLTRQASPTAQALADLIRAGQPLAAATAAPLLVRATQDGP